ncbi:MAG: DUF3341 domain-containing protein [Thermoanaerobaculia bacterium]
MKGFIGRLFARHVKPELGTPGPRVSGGELPPHLYGVIAEFANADGLLHAVHATRKEGYQVVEAYTPYPIEELNDAIGHGPSRVPLLVLLGGIAGGLFGFGLQYWTSVIDYPLNIGGRPYNSWVSFIPITFECTILFAGIAAVLGMLVLNGLPMPYHPVFSVPRFQLASRDRFFLMILARDPRFRAGDTFRFMETLGASHVSDVED